MAIGPGTRIGPYEVTALLGEGGMGKVWRAHHVALKRDDALKVLPEPFAADPERLARFQREAQVLASLNHPNIAHVYGLEERDGTKALVMELVEGPTLADRIATGPIPIDDALPIARQVAEALEAAHEQGIIHRDLKPANIKLRPDGTVKVLDFGLAKATNTEPPDAHLTHSPTLSLMATQAGIILGTAAYMAPEQARGQRVDKRADIWAFGVVLWEMLTGKRSFEGATASDVLAQVLTKQPDLELTPPRVRRLLGRCLEKDPKQRLRDIGEARFLLEEGGTGLQPVSAPLWSRLGWIAAAAFAALAAVLAALWLRPAPEGRALRFEINPPRGTEFAFGGSLSAAVSPDGRMIAFVAVSDGATKLWTRPLDSIEARRLPGTDGAEHPFWSPDSRSVGFFAEGKLKRIELSGGPPATIANAGAARGATWFPDGTVVFASQALSGFQRTSASGGAPVVNVTNLDLKHGETSHRWPQFLSGGRFLYFVQRSSAGLVGGVYLTSLNRPEDKTPLIENPYGALYAPPNARHPGYLLFLRERTLFAQPFDPARGRLSGEALPVPGAEAVSSSGSTQLANFSVSEQGTLVFGSGTDRYQLTWQDRAGKVVGTVGQPDRYLSIRISPDFTAVAASRVDTAGLLDDWRIDFEGGAPNRLTFDGKGYRTVWSRPDGSRIFYGSLGSMAEVEANGTGEGRTVVETQHPSYPSDWSPDGRNLMYSEISPETQWDLWYMPARGDDRKPVAYLKTPFNELDGQFSPEGKWVAYTSDEAGGRNEIYVRAFPAGAKKYAVSSGGGAFPRWRQDGKELFYRALDGRLMAVAVRTSAQGLEFGAPAALFSVVPPTGIFAYPYDVSRDGQRILALRPANAEEGSSRLTVLLNWQAALGK